MSDDILQNESASAGTAAATAPEQKAEVLGAAKLRETLAEAHATIRLIEQALVPVTQSGDEAAPPYEAFFRACQNGDSKAVAELLDAVDVNHRAAPGVTALHIAASRGQLEVVRLLLDNGADTEPRLGLLNCSYGYELAGATPLILAEANQRTQVAQLLVANGADKSATTDRGHKGQGMIQVLRRLGQSAINLKLT